MSIEELSAKVAQLTLIVNKQSKLIAQTGQKLIEIQVRDAQNKVKNHDSTSSASFDPTDFVSNEDIVQLVGELQGSLDDLETRSIKRLFNSKLSENTGIIAALSNKDGDLPGGESGISFPATYGEFKELSTKELVELSIFYELLLSEEPVEGEPTVVTEELVDKFKGTDGEALFNELARYLGLSARKGTGQW